MTSFQRKITKGVLWSAVDVLLRQGVQFVTLIIMARILAPEDFGVVALLALFVGLANVFIDGGFSSALIQRQNTTHIDESTIFFFNLSMGLLTSLTLAVSAPFISKLFEKPGLHYLIYAMALNVFIGAFGSIHTTLLTKELNLKLIAKVGGIASTLSGMLAIILAAKGFGVWSLAIQIVSASLISTLLLWLWHSWRPRWTFSINALGSYFRFGSYLMIAAIIDILHTNLYSVLIGKFYHIRDVGYYDRAQKTQLLPVNFIMLIINRVAFSTFSSVAEDKERIARVFRKAQQVVMFVNIPFAVVMIVMAEPIVLTLFGKQWLHSAPILEVLGIVGLIWPMHVLNINLLQAQGRADLFFKIMLIKKTVAISLTIAGSFHSIMALAWAQVAASVFSLIVNAYYSKVLLNYGLLRQLRDLTPSLMAAIPMGGVMWIVRSSTYESFYTELAIGLLSGGAVYLLLAYLFRMSPLWEIAGLLLKSKKSTLTVEGM